MGVLTTIIGGVVVFALVIRGAIGFINDVSNKKQISETKKEETK